MRSLTISIGGNYTTQRMNKIDVGDSDYNNIINAYTMPKELYNFLIERRQSLSTLRCH